MRSLSFAHAAVCSALVGARTATTPRTGLAQPGGNAVGESFAVASVRPVEKSQFRRPVLSQLPGGRFEVTVPVMRWCWLGPTSGSDRARNHPPWTAPR